GYISLNRHLLTSLRLYFISAISLVFIVGIGVWRNNSKINPETLAEIFLAEPLFTSITGALYIENSGGRPILSFPTDIIASVVNFIPSVIYPNKIDVINTLIYDANKEAPFGASSLIVNLYSNFGFL